MQVLLLLSGFLPATYLTLLCFVVLTSNLESLYGICILGILGYVGMFLLFLEHRINNWLILLLLFAGILSFILFAKKNDGTIWNWLIKFDDPFEWYLFVWPTIIAIINIARITIKKLTTQP